MTQPLNDDHLWTEPTVERTAAGKCENWIDYVRLRLRELEARVAALELADELREPWANEG